MIRRPGDMIHQHYSRFKYTLGELTIQAEDKLGLTPDPEEIRNANTDLLAYQNPAEAGRLPARIAVGMVASAATISVCKLKGWL